MLARPPWAFLAVLTLGCSADARVASVSPAPATVTPAAPSCEDAARQVVWLRYREPYPTKVQLVMMTCERDAWTPALRTCAAAAKETMPPPCDAVAHAALEQTLGEGDVALAEAARRLRALVAGGGELPRGSFGPVPAAPCCEAPKQVCAPGEGSYGAVWDVVGIRPEFARYHRYWLESDGAELQLRATADLDCDGEEAAFVLTAKVRGRELTVAIERPARFD